MKKLITLLTVFMLFYGIGYAQVYDTIVKWTFPNNPYDSVADGGIPANLDKTIRWTNIPGDSVDITTVSSWNQVITDTLPVECNDIDSVYIRWLVRDNLTVSGGTVAATGSSSIDDIKIWGHNISGITPPAVTNAYVYDLSHIKVIFNKPVNSTSENVSNYTGLPPISSAVLSLTLDTVTLTLAAPLINGDAYTLTIDNIEDTSSIPMAMPQAFNFLYNNSIANIVITEIMYNDPSTGANSDSLEFIELYNNSDFGISDAVQWAPGQNLSNNSEMLWFLHPTLFHISTL
ncbi:MAG: Ig-like domain-containing protein [Bacteroidia bacterium]|nr:Ig-like domain-containing protein [Bacteroidia bacterium]